MHFSYRHEVSGRKLIFVGFLALLAVSSITYSTGVQAFGPWNWRYERYPGVPAGIVGNTHQSMTDNIIKKIDNDTYGVITHSMKKAMEQISEANAKIDDNQRKSSLHFDGESFVEGQEDLQKEVRNIKRELSTEQGITEPTKAREALGKALHAVQDYYSHSNWIETYPSGGINSNLGVAGVSLSELPPTTPTCNDAGTCNCSSGACNNLLPLQLMITSGYYRSSKVKQDHEKKTGKCSHGGASDISSVNGIGINKDVRWCYVSPHEYLHNNAADRAKTATEYFINNVVKPELTTRQFNALLGYTPQLAIVIDTTDSMANKIAAAKQAATNLVNARLGTQNEPFLYVLVPFNDPGVGPATVTTDPNVFKAAINALTAAGGGDCPEKSISGIVEGLHKMTNFGDLFLITDAASNDGIGKKAIAKTLAWKKHVKVHTLAFGSCSPLDPAYITLKGTGGQLFYLPGTDVGSMVNFIDYVVRPNTVDVFSVEELFNNNTKTYPVSVDSTLTTITIAVSSTGGVGSISNVTIQRPDGSVVQSGDPNVSFTTLGVGALVRITTPSVGLWNVSVTGNVINSTSPTISLRVYGESSLDLTAFNFVEYHGDLDHEGYGPADAQPYIGQTTKALATVSPDGASTMQLQMRTKAGAVLQTLNFPEIQREPGAFREFGGDITIPTVPFLIYLVGTDTNGNQYQRVWAPVVKPQPLQIIAPHGLELVRGQTTLFKFKVKAFSSYGYDAYTFDATDSRGYYYSVTPSSKILSPGFDNTVDVTVEIRTPTTAVVGSLDTITFAAQGSGDGDNSNINGIVIDAEVVDNLPDTIPPAVDCSPNLSATATGGQNYAAVNYPLPGVQDNRNGAIVSCTPLSGSNFPVGTTTVTCTATDAAGNTNNCSFTITVTQNGDTTSPTITCPANVVTSIPYGQSSGVIYYSPPVVTDDRAGVTSSCSPASGSTFSRGTTTVACTATDAAGNQASCSFTVTIYDISLQDDASGDTLLYNSITGDYIFYRCGPNGITLSGHGTITRQGCLVKLGGDPKVSATLDSCPIAPANKGSATIKPNPIGGWFYITDSNTTNNTPPCPNG